jgi:tetratricopeptide (TPR) repeat protein
VFLADTVPRTVAEAFLRRRAEWHNSAASAEDLDAVLDRLGGLPLALEQAAAWVAGDENRRFAHFVALYDDASGDPFPDGGSPTGYFRKVTTTWRICVDAATDSAPLAGRIMGILRFLAPDDVPCDWLRDMVNDPYLDPTGIRGVGDALDALDSYSLATISGDDTISVHRVVQAVTRRTAGPDEAGAGAAIRTLDNQVTGDARNPQHWPTLAALAPHALAAAQTTTAALPDHANQLWRLLDDIAIYQRMSGAVRDAITTATIALNLATTHLGPDHPNTLRSRNDVARAYRDAGDLDWAIPLYEATIADRERVLGPDDPATLVSRDDLASAYKDAGDLDQAIPLYENGLADSERVLGPDHPDTVTSRNNLAITYRDAGDARRAIPLFEAIIADYERVLGPDDVYTLTSRNNLALAYRDAGDLAEAIRLFEAIIADRERVLGPDHPDTLTSRNDLATAYRDAGDLAQAIRLFEATVADRERVLDPDHPDTLTSRNDLACAYRDAGDLAQAIPLFETTLADRKRVLGPDHRDTLTSRANLEAARSL